MDSKEGSWLADAKIAAGVDNVLNQHPLSCDTLGVLNVNAAISSIFGPIDVIVNNVVPVSQSSKWTINYPIVAYQTNPSSLAQGTLVAIPGEPGGTPIGLTLVFTVAATEFWRGVIGGTGASYIRDHS